MMNNSILVSIVVPIYNAEQYVGKCIESILSQTYSHIELILVDDGSIDLSPTIIDDYALKDSRIKVVHKKNEGVSSARNNGLDIATGMYVTFADADDEMKSDCVEYLLKLITVNQTDVAYTDKLFTDYHMNQENDDSVQVISGEEAAERIILETYNVGVYCKIFKLDFLKQNNIRICCHVFHSILQTLFKFTTKLRTCKHPRQIKCINFLVFQRIRHITIDDTQSQSLNDSALTTIMRYNVIAVI